VLTPLDETLSHQTPDTFDHAYTSDHRFFDRNWFSANDPSGEFALITGIGAYANMDVMDGFVAVQHDGKQYNVRLSRQLRAAGREVHIGPLRHEVLEPLWKVRLVLEPGEHAVACNLVWEGVFPPHEEPHHFLRTDGRVVRDCHRFDQSGRVGGWIEVDGRRVDARDWWGARDHSWGVRSGVGGWEPPVHVDNVDGAAHEAMFVWLEFATERLGGHVQYVDTPAGHREPLYAFIRHRDDPDRCDVGVAADIDVELHPDTHAYRRAVLHLRTKSGASYEIEGTPLHTAWAYRGTGYNQGFADGAGLGAYRGSFLVEHDVYDVSHPEQVLLLPEGRPVAPGHREQPARISVNGQDGFGHFPIMFMRTSAA
jgi:hypothetical protein